MFQSCQWLCGGKLIFLAQKFEGARASWRQFVKFSEFDEDKRGLFLEKFQVLYTSFSKRKAMKSEGARASWRRFMKFSEMDEDERALFLEKFQVLYTSFSKQR
uniref:Uncharacterized protein n=1 Tax=Tanacetum cinerariifolium TaxID=118510 RepID=A0A6L2M8U7_TANCI|nr:hypothetical protein [Tanacetum cinerariifolium]